jgi:hypothetical protein
MTGSSSPEAITVGWRIWDSAGGAACGHDSAFLDWLFCWYLGTVELTNQLLARQASARR